MNSLAVFVLVALGALSCNASRLQCRHSSEPDCWLPEYIDWHRANRGRSDAKYLIWVCYRDDGLRGADAAARNVWGDCAGLGDRLRGIHYLTRIAYGVKRVLLVWQESPVLMEHFLSPADIDWRLTPDLGIDLRQEVAASGRHYVVGADPELNTLQDDILQGTFQQLPDRVVTVSTNWLAEASVGGPVPDLSQHMPLMGQLARALFRLSPAVEAATDAALASVGVQPGHPYVALHLRLGGQIGEEFAIQRFSLGQPHEVLQVASECAAGLVEEDKRRLRLAARAAAVLAPTQAAAALAAVTESESHMPHVLLTDNDDLRRRVSAGELPPWVSPELHPVHLRLRRIPGADNSSSSSSSVASARAPAAAAPPPAGLSPEEMAAVVRAHVASLADFGILVRARCVVLSPSGFSVQAQLLGNQACAATLGRDDRSGVEPCPGTERGWRWWWGQWWCRLVGGCGKKAGSGRARGLAS